MHTGSTFVAHIQSAKSVQPGEGALDDPARAAEAAAVRPVAARQRGRNPALLQLGAMSLRVVAPVTLDGAGLPTRRAGPSPDGRHGVDEGQQLADVVAVRRRQPRDERNPLAVGKNVMFRPGLAAIGRVRSSFFPPRNARSDALSTTARARSSWPRRRSSANNTSCRRCHTPARCQAVRRRQQMVPDPQPISRGSRFHGSPVRKMKRMPVSAARSGIGLRPAYRRAREGRGGRIGSIRAQSSSSIENVAIRDRLPCSPATVPRPSIEYKR